MKTWILQTGEPMPFDRESLRPMRAINLTNALASAGHEVTLWTADFDHRTHTHRYGRHTKVRGSDGISVRFLNSRGYRRNIGPDRLVDHADLGFALRRALRVEKGPDVAFIGYPPIEAAAVMVHWLHARGIPSMVDVKDAWPDVLNRAFPRRIRPVSRALMTPYYWMMARTFTRASALSSTAPPFLQWALDQAGRSKNDFDMVLPLTSSAAPTNRRDDHAAATWWHRQGVPIERVFRVSFIGTLHQSYEWAPVLRAAQSLPYVQFVICGDGSDAQRLRTLFEGCPNVVLPGWVNTAQALVLGTRSDVAIAPIGSHPDFEMSIPNKFYDALAQGTPVLTSLPGAAKTFVESHGVGRYYDANSRDDLTELLKSLMSDRACLEEMRTVGQRLHKNEYSVEKVYGRAVARLEEMAMGGTS